MADYIRSTFDLTACHPASDENNNINLSKVGYPKGTTNDLKYSGQSTMKYLWKMKDHKEDLCQLVKSCEMHECN